MGAAQVSLVDNPMITAAFRAHLSHQFLVVLILAIVLILAWNTIRTIRYRRAASTGTFRPLVPGHRPRAEPPARRLLRMAFGALWIVAGLFQTQVSMPGGLPDAVLKPAASSSPAWVQHLVNVGVTAWSNHPVSAAAAAVWIQLGIGTFLLVAPRGYWSRSAGAVSATWGLVVWVFGEAFGGVFAPGSSWLFGTPGAALLYVVAGVLVALPESRWETPRLGRAILRVTGLFFLGMGILQAWPGRGTWSGPAGDKGGTLAAFAREMAGVPQPSVFAAGPRSFASFDAAHGWAVNLVVVVLLIGIGVIFVAGRGRLLRVGVIAGAILCLVDWVLVQDLGFFGGVGTNPNSMIPMALLFTAGYLGVVKLPAVAPAGAAPSSAAAPAAAPGGLLGGWSPSYLTRSLAALGAVGIVLLGAAPMALAASNPNADAIVSEASDGTPNIIDSSAAPFTLTDQAGRAVSLRSLVGHVVVLTFLDPVCTTDCPLIAQELRATDQLLGRDAAEVDLVAVVNNPLYNAPGFTAAFDKQEGLSHLANWTFLSGSLSELETVWSEYGAQSSLTPAGAMVAHSDIVYIIDGRGRTREILDSDPGAGTVASQSSFSGLLASQVEHIVQS
jgi:cytochrome oxidase Cu insertion factor (SCO1/SenC/PrrC family)